MKRLFCLLVALMSALHAEPTPDAPVRLGVVGLVHGHVVWIFQREPSPDIEVVGIAEPDAALGRAMSEKFKFDPALLHTDVARMLDETKPDAVAVFTNIRDHLPVIRLCAERGIDVMVEKPLALDFAEAQEIEKLAREHSIHVLTNYETTWYPTVHAAKQMADAGALGTIRKIVAHDGHMGPQEIAVPTEFLGWLTDPALNGGGALIDFGCYGANLMTWMMNGERPLSVTAVTQQFKSDPVYRRVDDEATIILSYPGAQGIIQASWNWPFNIKNLEVYGDKGAVFAEDRTHLRTRFGDRIERKELPPLDSPDDDCFAYLAAVVRGRVDPAGGLASLPINVTVVEILDAARRSAADGKTVTLKR